MSNLLYKTMLNRDAQTLSAVRSAAEQLLAGLDAIEAMTQEQQRTVGSTGEKDVREAVEVITKLCTFHSD